MKKCLQCGESKILDCFPRANKEKDGFYYKCKDCKNSTQREFSRTPIGKYIQYKKRAKEKKFTFTLTTDEFMSFWKKDCSYCGDKIEGIGLDRVDNSIGYEIKNVVACCETCNTMKMATSYGFFINQCKKIIKFHTIY